MPCRRLLPGLALGAALALSARAARASLPDVFGLGSASAGEGGAVVAQATDFSACFYDPAGLAFGAGKTATAGAVVIGSQLEIQGRPQAIADPFAFVLGFDASAPLGRKLAGRLRFGLALVIPPSEVARVIAHDPATPFFPYYDNRTQRLVVLPALAVKILPGLALGVGANYLAGLAGTIQGTEGPTRAIDTHTEEIIGAHAALVAGLAYRPTPRWWFGAAYRQAFDVPFTESARTLVAGSPIDLDIAAAGLYTPDEVALGAAFAPSASTQGPVLELDAQWSRWSAYRGPYVPVTSVLPLVGSLSGQLPTVPYSDAWAVRLGGSDRVYQSRALALLARAGVGGETSPFPAEQPGVTNLMDGPKAFLSAGLGVELPHLLPRPVRIDAHAGLQLVGGRTFHKQFAAPGADPFAGLPDEDPSQPGDQTTNAGYPTLSGGGFVWDAGLTVSVEL